MWTSLDSLVGITGMVKIGLGGSLRINEGAEVIFETQESGINNKASFLHDRISIS